jgi:hypothetical protein
VDAEGACVRVDAWCVRVDASGCVPVQFTPCRGSRRLTPHGDAYQPTITPPRTLMGTPFVMGRGVATRSRTGGLRPFRFPGESERRHRTGCERVGSWARPPCSHFKNQSCGCSLWACFSCGFPTLKLLPAGESSHMTYWRSPPRPLRRPLELLEPPPYTPIIRLKNVFDPPCAHSGGS